jgi:hypothetical protein
MVAAAEERWRRSTTAATLTRLCGRCEVGGTALASSRLGARQRVADGDETADNERDHGGCTPSSMRSNTGGCCARVAERRAEHLGLPMYIWAGSCASAAPGRRKKCICYGSVGLCLREARRLADQGKATQRRWTPPAEQSPARARHEETGRPTLTHSP